VRIGVQLPFVKCAPLPCYGVGNFIGKVDVLYFILRRSFMPTRKIGKTSNRAPKSNDRVSLAQRKLKVALGRFARRVSDLILAYIAIGRLTPQLRREVIRLKSDIDNWRARTGNENITTHESSMRANRKISPAMTKGGCGYCDLIMFEKYRVCFLVDCDPRYRECSYVCIGVLAERRGARASRGRFVCEHGRHSRLQIRAVNSSERRE